MAAPYEVATALSVLRVLPLAERVEKPRVAEAVGGSGLLRALPLAERVEKPRVSHPTEFR